MNASDRIVEQLHEVQTVISAAITRAERSDLDEASELIDRACELIMVAYSWTQEQTQ